MTNTITQTHTDDAGVCYELHALTGNAKHEARIHVFDVDAGEAVGNTFYPTMDHAEAAYAELVVKAIGADTGIERQRIELPCECGATMVGEADVATREVAMEYHTAKAGEPIRFHFLECASCGSLQVS